MRAAAWAAVWAAWATLPTDAVSAAVSAAEEEGKEAAALDVAEYLRGEWDVVTLQPAAGGPPDSPAEPSAGGLSARAAAAHDGALVGSFRRDNESGAMPVKVVTKGSASRTEGTLQIRTAPGQLPEVPALEEDEDENDEDLAVDWDSTDAREWLKVPFAFRASNAVHVSDGRYKMSVPTARERAAGAAGTGAVAGGRAQWVLHGADAWTLSLLPDDAAAEQLTLVARRAQPPQSPFNYVLIPLACLALGALVKVAMNFLQSLADKGAPARPPAAVTAAAAAKPQQQVEPARKGGRPQASSRRGARGKRGAG